MPLLEKLAAAAMKVLGKAAPEPKPVPPPAAVLTLQKFTDLTGVVIDNFESGYYHPDMALHMNAADQELLKNSGETMYGLDRMAGGALAMYPEWAEFWSIIDKADARHKWRHYYLGGEYGPQLKILAAKIMYQWNAHLSAMYLKGDAITKIAADDRLIIHFAYSCWNGPGWYKIFAKPLNSAKGTKDEIFTTAIKARLNASSKAIRNAGNKMLELFIKMKLN